jgi:hypothetical protein
MLRHVALVRTDVSEERIVSIIRVKRMDELGTTLQVTSNRSKLRRNTSSPVLVTRLMETIHSFETAVLKQPHGVTSKKAFFIVTAVKILNLTWH